MSATPQEVTQLLVAWSDGDRSALDKLTTSKPWQEVDRIFAAALELEPAA